MGLAELSKQKSNPFLLKQTFFTNVWKPNPPRFRNLPNATSMSGIFPIPTNLATQINSIRQDEDLLSVINQWTYIKFRGYV